MAPINLPDGTEVSEIVLPDGSTASEVLAPDGSTVFSAIPESVVSQYNALDGFTKSDEGSTVSSWSDEQGAFDVPTNGGDVSITGSGINGKRSVDFGSSGNVVFQTTQPSIPQPFTVICLVEYKNSNLGFEAAYENGNAGGGSTRTQISHGSRSGAGSDTDVVGNGDDLISVGTSVVDKPMILSGVFNGSNCRMRRAVDGATSVDTATGFGGTNDANGWTFGSADGVAYHTGYAGVYLIFDQELTSSQLSEQESRIASEWGLSGGWT